MSGVKGIIGIHRFNFCLVVVLSLSCRCLVVVLSLSCSGVKTPLGLKFVRNFHPTPVHVSALQVKWSVRLEDSLRYNNSTMHSKIKHVVPKLTAGHNFVVVNYLL